ncbi:hypothetical protein R8510_00619 [Ralstonia chuxiongensis]|nr:hypothetical protein R8510_00619 [Ralstonia chuxiongensis]
MTLEAFTPARAAPTTVFGGSTVVREPPTLESFSD